MTVIFPHQLFEKHPSLDKDRPVFLIFDQLFLDDFHYPAKFHKKKLVLHYASMKAYEEKLKSEGYEVHFIDEGKTSQPYSCLKKFKKIYLADPCDWILIRRLKKVVDVEMADSPYFMSPMAWLKKYFSQQDKFFMANFYVAQRKYFNILVENGKPEGGKWSFDTENRKKLPKNIQIPLFSLKPNHWVATAVKHVEKHYPNHPGSTENFEYPVTHAEAEQWLDEFIEHRLPFFGPYQDAISCTHTRLFHSMLTPMLNIGLLTPSQVVKKVLKSNVPINSLEGFIRQIIGWREYVRADYVFNGVEERNSNFWGHHRKLPKSFYDGTTGIDPIDHVIRKLNATAYAHHIERLMVLGNFMLLCEIEPTEVYTWFMEMFIDSYDWVMVPNVYGMSQFADGGLITTKPYISSSNYILKMSDYKKGPWCEIWDGLFWRFIHKHRDFFAANPRLNMMVVQLDKMEATKLEHHLKVANDFLSKLNI